jgi:hypothetical protein
MFSGRIKMSGFPGDGKVKNRRKTQTYKVCGGWSVPFAKRNPLWKFTPSIISTMTPASGTSCKLFGLAAGSGTPVHAVGEKAIESPEKWDGVEWEDGAVLCGKAGRSCTVCMKTKQMLF